MCYHRLQAQVLIGSSIRVQPHQRPPPAELIWRNRCPSCDSGKGEIRTQNTCPNGKELSRMYLFTPLYARIRSLYFLSPWFCAKSWKLPCRASARNHNWAHGDRSIDLNSGGPGWSPGLSASLKFPGAASMDRPNFDEGFRTLRRGNFGRFGKMDFEKVCRFVDLSTMFWLSRRYTPIGPFHTIA
jgi:hypothetical protein